MKKAKRIISALCVACLLFSLITISAFAVTEKSVTATTYSTVTQGNTGYCYVYIDSVKGLAALDLAVHFDPARVKITNVYNNVSCTLYDSVTNTSDIAFFYIFDGEGSESKTQLFYFTYQVLSDAKTGDCSFDITIGEAYDSGLNDVAVSGSGCSFTIAEKVVTKSCSIYSTSSLSTKIEGEFTLNYRFSTYQIASGSVEITYDPELFEVVEVIKNSFLSNKVTDINTDLAGTVYISFVGTEYYSNTSFVTVKFRTLKNVAERSKIAFRATELCDKDLNSYSCSGYTTTVSVEFDDTYIGDAPKMTVTTDYDSNSQEINAVISIEENSRLGAGDFVLSFDTKALTFAGYEKHLSSDFFNVNDKQTADGIFKFSIVSLTDITAAQEVITLSFDAKPDCNGYKTALDLEGSMLADSLTNPIALNIIDGEAEVLPSHVWGEYVYNKDATVDANGTETAQCQYCDATDTRTCEDTKLPYISDERMPCVLLNDSANGVVTDMRGAWATRVYWGYIGEQETKYTWFDEFRLSCGTTYTADFVPRDEKEYFFTRTGYYRFVLKCRIVVDKWGENIYRDMVYTFYYDGSAKPAVPYLKVIDGNTVQIEKNGLAVTKMYYGNIGQENIPYGWFNDFWGKALGTKTYKVDFGVTYGEQYQLVTKGFYNFVIVYEDAEKATHEIVYTVEAKQDIGIITAADGVATLTVDNVGGKVNKLYWGYIGDDATGVVDYETLKAACGGTLTGDWTMTTGRTYNLTETGYYGFCVNYTMESFINGGFTNVTYDIIYIVENN